MRSLNYLTNFKSRAIYDGMLSIVIVCVLMMVLACTANINALDQHKKLDYQFMQGYMAQVSDYTQQSSRTDLTDAHKELLRHKRDILVQVYPLIKTYDQYVQSGQVPTAEMQTSILNLMNQLEGLVLK